MEETHTDRSRANEEAFASANERIRNSAERYKVARVPFLCECSAAECTALIQVEFDVYRLARKNHYFLLCAGHDDPRVERVVEEHGDYVIVEKST